MKDKNYTNVNKKFVHVFNEILAWEEASLKETCKKEKLTMREVHIMEAVSSLAKENKNTMANISKFLAVTPGSCSTSVNILVNKGFLEREYTPSDRRVIFINLTEKGEKINSLHNEIHKDVIEKISESLSEKETEFFEIILDKLDEIFANYQRR